MRLDAEGIVKATVAEIQSALQQRGGAGRRTLALLEQDERAGVRRLAVRERVRFRTRQADRRRIRGMRDLEERFRAEGAQRLAGVDEVGRGCLAGPVVAAAVILPEEPGGLEALDDSKVLDADTRQVLRERIFQVALGWSVAAVDAGEIDRINILEASMQAMRLAVNGLHPPPDRVLVDGNRAPVSGIAETTLIGGDARSLSIAAASVVAKQHRDELMIGYDATFPGYEFAANKGYASPVHRHALDQLGPSALHRRSFAPLATGERFTLPLRQRSDTGARGETAAADYLRAEGYRIVTKRYLAAGGEIDLVVWRDDCFVFVEVKTSMRPSRRPEERISLSQQGRIGRAAAHYIQCCVAGGDNEYRFDVIVVDLSTPKAKIEHLQDAFEVPVSRR